MSTIQIAVAEKIAKRLQPTAGVQTVKITTDNDCSKYSLTVLPYSASGSKAFHTARSVFVLLTATDAPISFRNIPKVVGFGHSDAEATWQELQCVIAEYAARLTSQDDHIPLSRPTLIDPLFVSHFRGVMRHFYRNLQDVLSHITPIPATKLHDPFLGISPTHWLNFYGHRKLGAFLTDAEAEDLWKTVFSKKFDGRSTPKKGEDTFRSIFQSPTNGSGKPILLLGETGTGKTVLANMIHAHLSQYATNTSSYTPPFTQINCAGLGSLLESELFGAMVGSYTGADVTNPGKILASFGGVLFLDEIGTMSLQAQARLLTYLDRGEVSPQGWGSEPLHVPVQIVAATNADLLDEVQKGNFRADLYYRFEQHLHIPPLRERAPDDLELLIAHALTTTFATAENSAGQPPVHTISRSAFTALLNHDYPGNYRELLSLLRNAVKKAQRMQDHVIRAQDVEFEKSSLPTQHAVIGIVRKYEKGKEWLLLRFNPHWLQYFLIGGRFETKEQTFENALTTEMNSKIGLTNEQYVSRPVELGKELALIQYSDRDKQLKRYIFHPYSIRLKEGVWSDDKLTERGLLWVTADNIDQERGPKGEPISRTVKELAKRAGGFSDREQFPLSLSLT